MKRLLSIFALTVTAMAAGQDLVAYSSNGVLSATDAQTRFAKLFKDQDAGEIEAKNVRLYKTAYKARMPDGRKVQLSGLVAIPAGGAPKGLIVFFHGTTTDRNNVPSRYRGEPKPEEADMVVLAFATAGYAVAAPDYLGLGDHRGFHPYPLGSVNCWSGIDLIRPARAIAAKTGTTIGPDLFVTGYSEGGAVAMWATQKLQNMREPEYRVTRAAPLSGPYDLSGAQALSILENQSNAVWLGARVYFASYVARGIQKTVYPIKLEDYFSPSFASYIPFVFNQELGDEQTIKKLVGKALQLGAFQNMNRIMTLRFRDALKAADTRDPVIKALKDNDCCNWRPKVPIYLVCIEDDFLVTKQNTLNAIKCMRQLGVGPDLVCHYVIGGRKYDHMKGAIPAIILARRFFEGGFPNVPTTTD